MLLKFIWSVVYAGIMTIVYGIAANIAYYIFNGQTMIHDFHYYAWVQYAYAAGFMFVLAFVVELIRVIIAGRRRAS